MREAPAVSSPAMRREADARRALPYARHVTPEIVALDSGALMLALQLEGASFETVDVRDLNDAHAKLNGAWRNLADERLAVWHHLVRRPYDEDADETFRSPFAAGLGARYRARLNAGTMFVNDLYVTLVWHPGRAAGERAVSWLNQLGGKAGPPSDAHDVDALQALGRDLASHLGRYGPRVLGLYQKDGLWFSEPMEMLRLVFGGRPEPVPLVRGKLGSALHSARVIFGREALEVRETGTARYGAMLGVKEYPATTRPGLWNGLLAAPFALLASQSFTFLSKAAARQIMTRKQNQMLSAGDRAASQIEGLSEALDDLTSGRFVMGDHQASVLVWSETLPALAESLSKARAMMAESGLVAVREDLGLEAAFWAQFPGNFRYRVRPAAITSRNFAAFAPFHTYPAGKAAGHHWGRSVALLRTAGGSPFHFSFHQGDLGHTFICGPSGSGKTVVQNFLLAQLEKLDAQQVFIDKDRGAEIFVRACGGAYLTLRTGEPTGFAPFKALGGAPADRAFLGALVRQLAGPARLTAREARAIDAAIIALEPLAPRERSLSALRVLLGQRDAEGLGARLEPWCQGGALGWALDGDADALGFEARFLGFDMTQLLDNAQVRTPVMMYLLHRLQALVDGRRLVVDIDEFWKALGDAAFTGFAEDGLKTYRKQNAFMVFGTQSPADVLASPIAHTVLEQCATKIFLPNPHAAARDYVDGFALSEREFSLVRDEMIPAERQFLIKQGPNAVVAELRLDGLEDDLAVLSGRRETVDLLDRIRALCGDDPADWLQPFQDARRRLP